MVMGFKLTRDMLLESPRLEKLPPGEYAVKVTHIAEAGAKNDFIVEYEVVASSNDDVAVGGCYKYFLPGTFYEESKKRARAAFFRACLPADLRCSDSDLMAMDEKEAAEYDIKLAKFMRALEKGNVQPTVGVRVIEQLDQAGKVKTSPAGKVYTSEYFAPLED